MRRNCFWQIDIYTHDNMFNLHRMQRLIIRMQMDNSVIILVRL
jgi:hypothetical protein